ncbi:hypothetical protein C8F04DRAFT_1237810 [Mycena alexandri]|uniref:BZIP domain-containing protein n=1 Tax=Mycena alexandri TaxID=1745969 RepID=A0AAD6SJI6_9AGAR|nr:hypothetical protein C8F04DRAFT_1237810 [Mycena alexandri]
MTRGRKKDATIPPTRALTLQRDYRARKTRYVLDLELRCRRAEEENVRLKQEVAFLRQQNGHPIALSPSLIQASAQLQDILAAASTSVSHFMQIALPTVDGARQLTPSYDPLLACQPNTASVDLRPNSATGSAVLPRSESPCCGGYIDCEDLVEDEGDMNSEGVVDQRLEAISQIRSTSEVD